MNNYIYICKECHSRYSDIDDILYQSEGYYDCYCDSEGYRDKYRVKIEKTIKYRLLFGKNIEK